MNRVANILRANLVAQVPRRSKAYLGELKGTMNDLPQPSGSWKTNNDAKQRKYNAQLFLGVAFLAVTLVIGEAGGFFYMNASPPARPADKNDYSK